MHGQVGAWSLICGLWAPGDPQFYCSLPVTCGALSWATSQLPSYSWEHNMEVKSQNEVKLESPKVDRDSKPDETQSTNYTDGGIAAASDNSIADLPANTKPNGTSLTSEADTAGNIEPANPSLQGGPSEDLCAVKMKESALTEERHADEKFDSRNVDLSLSVVEDVSQNLGGSQQDTVRPCEEPYTSADTITSITNIEAPSNSDTFATLDNSDLHRNGERQQQSKNLIDQPKGLCAVEIENSKPAEQHYVEEEFNSRNIGSSLNIIEDVDQNPSGTQQNIKALCGESDAIPSADNITTLTESEMSRSGTSASLENDLRCVEVNPQEFLTYAKLNEYKDIEVDEIKEENASESVRNSILLASGPEAETENSISFDNLSNSQTDNEIPRAWQSMDLTEKKQFLSFLQSGIPHEEAIARLNGMRLQVGRRDLIWENPCPIADPEASTSADTCQRSGTEAPPKVENSRKQPVRLNGRRLAAFRELRKSGMPRPEAWAKIQELVRLEENLISESPSMATENTNLKGSVKSEIKQLKIKRRDRATYRKYRNSGMSSEEALARTHEFIAHWNRLLAKSSSARPVSKHPQSARKNLLKVGKKALRKLAIAEKKERNEKFNKFDRNQKWLHMKLREEGMSHANAVNKVLEVSYKIGTKNIKFAIVEKLSSEGGSETSVTVALKKLLGSGTSLHTNLPVPADCATDAPALGDSEIPNQSFDESKDVDITDHYHVGGECPKHYEEYGDFILDLKCHPKCEHSLDEIVEMAKQVPEAHGIYGRKLFIMRCYQFGADPNNWDWSQYSQVPAAPKIFPQSIPKRKSVQKSEKSQACKQLSCTHASCEYFSPSGAALGRSLKQQQQLVCETTYDSSSVNVSVVNSHFNPYQGNAAASSSYDLAQGWSFLKQNQQQPVPKTTSDSSSISIDVSSNQFNYQQDDTAGTSSCSAAQDVSFIKHKQHGFKTTFDSNSVNGGEMTNQCHPHIDDTSVSSSYGDQKNPEDKPSGAKRFRYEETSDSKFAGSEPKQDPSVGTRLAIVPSRYPSECLDDDEMYELENSILEAVLEIPNERMRPNFNGSFHNNGRYEVICLDQFSKEWLYRYVSCMDQQWAGLLKIIPADCVSTSASVNQTPRYNHYERRATRESPVPRSGSSSRSDSNEREGYRQRSKYAGLYQQDQPTRRNLQDRLGPKVSPHYSSRNTEHDQPLYIEASQRDDVTDGSSSRIDSPDRGGYGGGRSSYVSTFSSSQERYDYTGSWSPKHSRSGYIEYSSTARQEMHDKPRRNSSIDTAYEELPVRYWEDEHSSNDYLGRSVLERSVTHHSRSPSPYYSRSRDLSGYCKHDRYYRSPSPVEPSRTDARERLRQIRTNRH